MHSFAHDQSRCFSWAKLFFRLKSWNNISLFTSKVACCLPRHKGTSEGQDPAFEIVSCLPSVTITWKIAFQSSLNCPLQDPSRIRVSKQQISSLAKTTFIFTAERQNNGLMLYMNNINLNEKQISKMMDLDSMKSVILFRVSNLEFLTNLLRRAHHHCFYRHYSQEQHAWENNRISRNFFFFNFQIRIKALFSGDWKDKAFKNWGQKSRLKKKLFFQLHRLNLRYTDWSLEHRENYADIFKAKLRAWGIQLSLGWKFFPFFLILVPLLFPPRQWSSTTLSRVICSKFSFECHLQSERFLLIFIILVGMKEAFSAILSASIARLCSHSHLRMYY